MHSTPLFLNRIRGEDFPMRMPCILLLLLVGAGIGCDTGPPADVLPVTGFEVERYLGTWYEIARLDHRFERGLTRVTAEYSLNQNGTVSVVNRGYNEETDTWARAEGIAKFRGERTVGSLKVSFFGPFYGGYHIVELDRAYQYALIAGPSKDYLWILARSPALDNATYQRLVETATALGFPTEKLIRVEHDTMPAPPVAR